MSKNQISHQSENDYEMNIDIYSILKDIFKYAAVVLLLAASISLLTYVYVGVTYHKQYESSSTFIVSGKGSNNNIYSNLETTSQMATKFSQILNSSILQKKVAQEMKLGYFPGMATAEVIDETNLLVLHVKADSPEMAFRLNKSIMNNYSVVSDSLMGSVVLDVLQQPTVPSSPANEFQPFALMRKVFVYTVGIFCALIAIVSFLKDTVRKPKEIASKVDTKLLETIYHEKRYKSLKARLHRKRNEVLLLNPGMSFRYVEDMKKLARKVSNQMKDRSAKTLLVSSVKENEGKSTVATNLALALVEESEKVILIDGDLRNPSLYKIFGMAANEVKQFGEVLNGNISAENLIVEAKNSELCLVMGTMIYPNSTELLAMPVFIKMLEFCKENFDYVIIDTPAMSKVADAEELVDMVDATLLVVKQHTALVKDINDAVAVLDSSEHRLLGCVYNDVFQGVAETAKQYGYGGYGYGYGSYGSQYGYGYGSGSRHGYGYGSHYGYGYGTRNKDKKEKSDS